MEANGPIFRSPLFWGGLAAKLLLGGLFGSEFATRYFAPFVAYYVDSGFQDPYAHFSASGLQAAFPYPPMMLYVLAAPRVLLGWLDPSAAVTFFDLFLLALPQVAADVTLLLVLWSWLRREPTRLLVLYWLSPVIIYITYVHRQLDVIPLAFLFVSMQGLFRRRLARSAVFLGLALATKTHIALAVPFFALYAVSLNVGAARVLALAGIAGAVFLGTVGWRLGSEPFLRMVFLNAEQGKALRLVVQYGAANLLYVVPAAYLLLLLRGALMQVFTRDAFLMLLAFSFGVLLLFIPPMQGWYLWLLPFLAYFYVKGAVRSVVLFGALQTCYLVFFLLVPGSDYLRVFQVISPAVAAGTPPHAALLALGVNADAVSNAAFTVLQAVLLANCIWVYHRELQSHLAQKLLSAPYMIGIGGDSGAGKTTLARALGQIFGPRSTTTLRGDDMHRWERGNAKWSELTHLDPRANELHREGHYLAALRRRRSIARRHYDHDSGCFTREQKVAAGRIVLVEGLHTFYLRGVRGFFDLKIFVRPDAELGKHWKIIRDTKRRNHSLDRVLAQIRARAGDARKFVETQSRHADIVIETCLRTPIPRLGDEGVLPDTFLRFTCWNSFHLEPLIAELQAAPGLQVRHEYGEDDRQVIEVEGEVPVETRRRLAERLLPRLEEFGIGNVEPIDEIPGLPALVIVHLVLQDGTHTAETVSRPPFALYGT